MSILRCALRARSVRSVGAISGCLVCAYANAGFTPIGPPSGFELTHAEVLQSFYGGVFTADIGGISFDNGTIFAERVNDFGFPGVIVAETSDGLGINDEFWAGLSVIVVPRYVGGTDETGLGLIDGDGAFIPVAPSDAIGQEFAVDLSNGVNRWALANATTGDLLTSNPSDNADQLDHMVTYRIDSKDSNFGTRWVIFWEDRLDGQLGFDLDYNDAVFEIIAVPAPGTFAALALASVFPGLSLGARRRRSRS